jgi:hypothetical protein
MTGAGRRVGWVVGVAVLAAALGCKPSAGNASLDTLEGFCLQTNAVSVNGNLHCLGGTPFDYASNDYCAKFGMAKIQYDAAAAMACVAETQAAATACRTAPACTPQVEKGLVPDGQACSFDEECATGSFCVRSDDTSCTQRVCTSPAPVGSPCVPFPGCVPEGVCDGVPPTCIAATLGDVGAACGDRSTALCKDGLFCMVDPMSTVGAGTCQPTPTPPAGGCLSDIDCDVVYEFCDADMTCKPRIAAGQSCLDHPSGCQLLAACDPQTNRCRSGGRAGQPCSSVFNLCFFDSTCDFTNAKAPVCVALKMPGAACTNAFECASGVCRNSLCVSCPP